jgi:PIN domain nuclease of toxin-antitoxin system
MRVLIDTHVFIWWTSDIKKLSVGAYNLLQDPSAEVIVSLISIWEIQIKASLGKLQLKSTLQEVIEDEINRNRIELLPLSHIYALSTLPHHHRDPFDRLLVAQAFVENLSIISIDEKFDAYGISRIW